MFELLFNHPRVVFSRGEFVLLGGWAPWLLPAAIAVLAGALGFILWRRRTRAEARIRGWRLAGIWGLESALIALVLALLWQPAVRVSALKPQQNVVAVVVDDSGSMTIADEGKPRRDNARALLEKGMLDALRRKFQVRLYRMSDKLERIEKPDELTAAGTSTRIGESLKQAVAESASLPIGAIVLISDGADNSGGVDLETISEIRSRRIPVHTIGLGKERPGRDIEITDAVMPAKALPDSRLLAQVTLTQRGYDKQKARLTVREGNKILASREITLQGGDTQQTESLLFNAGVAGAKLFRVSVEPLQGEENQQNNAVSRMVQVTGSKPRILYLEGEPRWEFKFIRRAAQEDRTVKLVTMMRTTQNKIYRQDVEDAKELEQGFPANVDELFRYQAVILGSVELGYFTPAQQELLRNFVDRRGGGLLWLGARTALSDGGWAGSTMSDLMPAILPTAKNTFQREAATAELTAAGRESLICRLVEDPEQNAARWRKLPHMASYQDVGSPKPGAVVLADMLVQNRGRLPLLITQNYGRGRTAIFATGGSWRWQMLQELKDQTHEMFWQQLLRWLVAETPGRIVASTPRPVLSDEGRVALHAEVRDPNYLPMADARVEARIIGPEGIAATVEMDPDTNNPGSFTAAWTAEKPGSYISEIQARRGEEEPLRDVVTFQRLDGVAEHFGTGLNRELLAKLSEQTGGRYWRAADTGKLPEEISYSEAGITIRETKELWNMP
ncbi:MAG: glutamine amidotransferase, partial [Bryobacteraceae bacterium]